MCVRSGVLFSTRGKSVFLLDFFFFSLLRTVGICLRMNVPAPGPGNDWLRSLHPVLAATHHHLRRGSKPPLAFRTHGLATPHASGGALQCHGRAKNGFVGSVSPDCIVPLSIFFFSRHGERQQVSSRVVFFFLLTLPAFFLRVPAMQAAYHLVYMSMGPKGDAELFLDWKSPQSHCFVVAGEAPNRSQSLPARQPQASAALIPFFFRSSFLTPFLNFFLSRNQISCTPVYASNLLAGPRPAGPLICLCVRVWGKQQQRQQQLLAALSFNGSLDPRVAATNPLLQRQQQALFGGHRQQLEAEALSPFRDFDEFAGAIKEQGLAAMELLAIEMKVAVFFFFSFLLSLLSLLFVVVVVRVKVLRWREIQRERARVRFRSGSVRSFFNRGTPEGKGLLRSCARSRLCASSYAPPLLASLPISLHCLRWPLPPPASPAASRRRLPPPGRVGRMQASGAYVSRALSFKSCEYSVSEAPLTRAQRRLYDACCAWWTRVRACVRTAAALVGRSKLLTRMMVRRSVGRAIDWSGDCSDGWLIDCFVVGLCVRCVCASLPL